MVIKNEIKRILSRLSLVAFDLLGLALALTAAYELRVAVLPRLWPVFPDQNPQPLWGMMWWALAIGMVCFAYEGLYNRRLSFWRETKKLVSAVTLAFIFILAAVSLGKMGGEVSRTVLVTAYFLSLIFIPLIRYTGKIILWYTGLWSESILLLGTGEIAQKIASTLMNDRYLGYRVYGFLDNTEGPTRSIRIKNKEIPLRGSLEDTATILAQTGIKQVIIALPDLSGSLLVSLTNQIQPYTRSIMVVPDLCGIPVMGGEAEYFFEDQILAFRTHNNLTSLLNIIVKRLFDLFVGMVLLLPSIPLMLILTVIIRLDSPGPAIYAGTRIGREGRLFKCYKFRTMLLNNDEILQRHLEENPAAREEWENFAKLRGDDPRLTRVGRVLRQLSLDELPQIFNVMKGEMSLVGARPYLVREKELMHEYADTILLANPGITGLWQVSGRNELDFESRMKLETWYIRNWSLWLDISLLFRTIPVLLRHRGAY